MNGPTHGLYISQDAGLLAHWNQALGEAPVFQGLDAMDLTQIRFPSLMWVDLATPHLPAWRAMDWTSRFSHPLLRVIATSSNPKDAQAVAALDAGCAGYCHAYAEAATLRQVAQVVQSGHVWIGAALMQKLIQTAQQAVTATPSEGSWSEKLTSREFQVAQLVAKGSSNQEIAGQCDISERTVKAHLSAIFGKLGVADRLQLALKVHGIQ